MFIFQDPLLHSGSHPLKAVPIAVADEEESESEEDELKPRGERAKTHASVSVMRIPTLRHHPNQSSDCSPR